MYFINLFFILSAILVLASSCTPKASVDLPLYRTYEIGHSESTTPGNSVFLKTFSYQQTTGYTCGPAIVMSLLYYYGKLSIYDLNAKTEMHLAQEMGTTLSGTSQDRIVSWLEHHGFHVEYGQHINSDLLFNNLKNHIPVLMVWNDWSGHFMMAVGYSIQNTLPNNHSEIVFFADPESSNYVSTNQKISYGINTFSLDEVETMWFNALYTFNPTHTEVGMYIIATPK